MDIPRRTPPEVRFIPDRRYTVLAGSGALGAIAALLLTSDAAGRVLSGLAAVLLLSYLVCDLVFSPRIVASAGGIVINAPLTRARLDWADVHHIRAETRMRRGLRSTTLEIDASSVLAVFTRRTLGAEPAEAAALIEAFRPRRP